MTCRRPGRPNKAGVLAALLAIVGAPAIGHDVRQAATVDRAPLGVMGTVPLYWGEVDELSELLDQSGTGHWARPRLEQEFDLMPIDYLSSQQLAAQRYLLMAQPRGLAPEENVALDDWVRSGGRLLLMVDPMMTGKSRFGIGDRRRPQDVALLSPILGRWGLQLLFDADQVEGLQMREIAGTFVPVNLAGHLALSDPTADCELLGDALLAQCRIGDGQVTILSDAALLDIDGPWPGARDSLAMLVHLAFGDDAGNRSAR